MTVVVYLDTALTYESRDIGVYTCEKHQCYYLSLESPFATGLIRAIALKPDFEIDSNYRILSRTYKTLLSAQPENPLFKYELLDVVPEAHSFLNKGKVSLESIKTCIEKFHKKLLFKAVGLKSRNKFKKVVRSLKHRKITFYVPSEARPTRK